SLGQPPRDLAAGLRRQLRRRRAGRCAPLARAAVGRQRHDALLLAGRHREPRERLVLLQHPVRTGRRPAPPRLGRPTPHPTAAGGVDARRAAGGERIVTARLIGWTPIDRVRRWGFSVAKYGPQQATECTVTGFPPWCEPDAGNGNHPDGTPITGNDPHDTSREIGPDFVTGWLAHIAGRVGTAGQGGPRLFALDNEPDLWNSTHRDVHPTPLSYDEIWQRTADYASAIKAQDSDALVMGPVPWGWCAYFWSALDGCSDGGPDLAAHGGVHYLEWYLKQAHDYETANGVRLVDYLDIHYYPQANGVALTDDESVAALRLRTLKSLYDPSYIDESWIGTCCGSTAVNLIPSMN